MERSTVNYKSLDAALAIIADARKYQTSAWPSTLADNASNRPFEEWILLTDVYLVKLKTVYAETPSYIGDGTEPNVEGRKRIEKYAAIVANLMIWAVQAATIDK